MIKSFSPAKLAWLLCLFLFACHNHSEEHKLLEEAAQIHLEAAKIEQSIKADLEQLIQEKNSINIQGRALMPEEIAFTRQVEAIQKSYSFWEDNQMEVPGFEHHGDGHDHHHHHHGGELDLPPEDILLVQKELKDSILSIQQKIQNLQQK